MLGDVMLGRQVNRALARRAPEHVWGDTLPVLRGADAVVCNLECVIADGGRPQPGKTFTFRSDAANVAVLAAGHVAAVSLANNHALDYGTDALLECLDVLDAHGIAHAGAGRTLEDAQRPALVAVGDSTMALVACTDNEPTWAAGPHDPGIFHVPIDPGDARFAELCAIVSAARPGAGVVVVSVHWGPNWGYDPPAEHLAAAQTLIDAGADVVFGHSPHVFRGIGTYRGRPVLYSAGDFVDDYAVDPIERNDQSFMFVLEYTPGGLQAPSERKRVEGLPSATLIPTVIGESQVALAVGEVRADIERKMQRLCAALGTQLERTEGGLALAIS